MENNHWNVIVPHAARSHFNLIWMINDSSYILLSHLPALTDKEEAGSNLMHLQHCKLSIFLCLAAHLLLSSHWVIGARGVKLYSGNRNTTSGSHGNSSEFLLSHEYQGGRVSNAVSSHTAGHIGWYNCLIRCCFCWVYIGLGLDFIHAEFLICTPTLSRSRRIQRPKVEKLQSPRNNDDCPQEKLCLHKSSSHVLHHVQAAHKVHAQE